MSIYIVWVGIALYFKMLVLYNIGIFSIDIAKPDDIRLYGYWEEWDVLLDLEKLLGCVSLNLQRS